MIFYNKDLLTDHYNLAGMNYTKNHLFVPMYFL